MARLADYAGKKRETKEYTRLMRQLKHIGIGRKFSREEMNKR